MLALKNLSFSYPGRRKPVIDDMTAEIPAGGVYGLLGPNGAGKSTLLYLIAGLLTPKQGSVELDGVNTRLRRVSTLQDIFVVPEELSLPPVTVKKYCELNAAFYPNFSAEDLKRHLETFEIDSEMPYKLSNLSMGQKKKVYMCFALACNTPVLLMDEPTNGLDIPGKAAFRRFIASSADESKTIIISTHQVKDVERILDHIFIMNDSRIMLNEAMGRIGERLAFMTTTDPTIVAKALYTVPSIGGTGVVIENDGSMDTEIDLEILFSLATTKPEIINRIFTNK